MARRIVIIQGHPDAAAAHLCHALADAYRDGALAVGHQVRETRVADLSFPLIRSKHDFEHGERPACIVQAQREIHDAQHLLLVYPLWLGTMPALLKGFLEQVFRYDFAFEPQANGRFEKRLSGRSARIVVTMGMPALAYRWYFGAHGLKSLERSILGFCGIRPIRESLFGMVEAADDRKRERWLSTMRGHGSRAR
jgi:putative NADPH-quinone reductase